ncbi:MAG: zf-HC2 domain-containing protein [Bryobacteraceae bacterium]
MVTCRQVAAELSNLISEEVDPRLRREIENHLRHCRRCSVLLDSVRKVLIITGDERTFELPPGFSERLHRFLDQALSSPPGESEEPR